jgi:hypothetical protein
MICPSSQISNDTDGVGVTEGDAVGEGEADATGEGDGEASGVGCTNTVVHELSAAKRSTIKSFFMCSSLNFWLDSLDSNQGPTG